MADSSSTSTVAHAAAAADGASSSSSIVSLSADQLFSILLLLPVDSILSLALTCKRFKSLACSDSLWEPVCRRDWGQACVDALKSSFKARNGCRSETSWLEVYKKVKQLDAVRCQRLDCVGSEPSPRASHSLNFVSDCLVLFGGGCEGGRHLDDTWVAYIGNNLPYSLKWQRIDSRIPTGRFGHTCVVLDDYLVLFGGINDNGLRQNDTWIGKIEFNGATGITLAWKLLNVGSSCMPPPRGAHAACCIGNSMIVHGGIGLSGVRLGDTWVLDLSLNNCSGRWHEIFTHSAPPARSGHSLTSIGGTKAVLFGGRGAGYEVLGDVWLIDLNSTYIKWVQVCCERKDTPAGVSLSRVGHSATLILGGRVLIHGGEDSFRHKKGDFWLLDIKAKTSKPTELNSKCSNPKMGIWKLLKSNGYIPNSRAFHRACTDHSGRQLYVFGGMVDGPLQPGGASGLRFDKEIFVVELMV